MQQSFVRVTDVRALLVKEGEMAKRSDVALTGLALLLAGVTYASYGRGAEAQELTCADINCGKGSCQEPGTPGQCTLSCNSGTEITCKKA
jgi:hypothetical protein